MENFDIKKYIEIALRRKYWVVIPFMLILLGGFHYVLKTPKIYEASTLILVQEQKVPQAFIRSIVTSSSSDRLRTMSQQVLSRTNLEKIISDNKLYVESEALVEEKVQLLRRSINIKVARGNSFSISVQGRDPRKVMQVTNALSSNFISENIKIRESQAMGTSIFLTDELESVEKRLLKKEETLRNYRQRYMGAMPNHINTNLRMLEKAQADLEALYVRLNETETRKLVLQQQVEQSEQMNSQASGVFDMNDLSSFDDGLEFGSESGELIQLNDMLKSLKLKYTDNHPNVREINSRIAKLEAQLEEDESGESITENEEITEFSDFSISGTNFLEMQLNQIDVDIKALKQEILNVKESVAFYNKRVEDTPKREQELISISRDYDNLKSLYDNMLNRKLEAELSVSMERKQKGEQFRVIDPAQIPLKPVKPDIKRLIFLVIGLGLGIGCGIAYLVELLDTSCRSPEDTEKELGIPVLVSLPYLFTEHELSHRRKKRILIASSMGISYAIALFAVVVFSKGFNETINFIKDIF